MSFANSQNVSSSSCNSYNCEHATNLDQATINKISSINNWKWAFNYIKKHPEHTDAVLHLCDENAFNTTLLDWLAAAALITPHTYDKNMMYVDVQEFRAYENEIIAKVKTITHWRHLFNYIKKHRDDWTVVHAAINFANDSAYTSELLYALREQGIIISDEELKQLLKHVKPSSRPGTPNSESKAELKLLDTAAILNKIKSITNEYHMYNYIKKHPENVHHCMVYSDWNVFTPSLIKRLLKDGLLDPYKMHPAYNFQEETNINFAQHIKALFEEVIDEDKVNVLDEIYSMIE